MDCEDLMESCHVKMCRICFVTDSKMYSMTSSKVLNEAYETLTGILTGSEQRLPRFVCAECADRLMNCARFRRRSLRARSLLLQVAGRHGRITVELVHSIANNQNPFSRDSLSNPNDDRCSFDDQELGEVSKLTEEQCDIRPKDGMYENIYTEHKTNDVAVTDIKLEDDDLNNQKELNTNLDEGIVGHDFAADDNDVMQNIEDITPENDMISRDDISVQCVHSIGLKKESDAESIENNVNINQGVVKDEVISDNSLVYPAALYEGSNVLEGVHSYVLNENNLKVDVKSPSDDTDRRESFVFDGEDVLGDCVPSQAVKQEAERATETSQEPNELKIDDQQPPEADGPTDDTFRCDICPYQTDVGIQLMAHLTCSCKQRYMTAKMDKLRRTRKKVTKKYFIDSSCDDRSSDVDYDPVYEDNISDSDEIEGNKNKFSDRKKTLNLGNLQSDSDGSNSGSESTVQEEESCSSTESIFETRKRFKKDSKSLPTNLRKKSKMNLNPPNSDTPDNLSIDSEVLRRNTEGDSALGNVSFLVDPADNLIPFQPDPAILEDRPATRSSPTPFQSDPSIVKDSTASHLSPAPFQHEPEIVKDSTATRSLPAPYQHDPEIVKDSPATRLLPTPFLHDPAIVEDCPASHSLPAPFQSHPEIVEERPAPRSSPAPFQPDPEIVEDSSALRSSPALFRSTPAIIKDTFAMNPSPLVPQPELAIREDTLSLLRQESSNFMIDNEVLNDVQPSSSRQTRRRMNTPSPVHEWEDTYTDIPEFEFDEASVGVQFEIGPDTSPLDIFNKLFPPHIVDYIVSRTNEFGRNLYSTRRATSNTRERKYKDTDREEMLKFLGLCLLMGQVNVPNKRKLFSYSDPLYYHPIFQYVMSCRRYEQLLRCLCLSESESKGEKKVTKFIDFMTKIFQECYKPDKELSLDESLLLFRGRLSFRQYIKSKKARYGIKFFELTTSDGYVLNMFMYAGKSGDDEIEKGKKTEKIVLRLMDPYLLKGHQVYMDNYYNSVSLSHKLIQLNTHSTGTLRSNRKDNPTDITEKKLKKGQHVWVRKNKVYVSKWVDKRPVLMVTTLKHPKLIVVSNRYGQEKIKPQEVAMYNKFMSGIDRSDQMIMYYSSPRKTLRWYKKVFFHLLDISVWNSFYIYRKYCKHNNRRYEFVKFREDLIKSLIQLPPNVRPDILLGKRHKNDNRTKERSDFVSVASNEKKDNKTNQNESGHWPEKIPVREMSKKKSNYMKCKMCSKKKYEEKPA